MRFRTVLGLLFVVAVVVAVVPAAYAGTLLQDHFGVNLALNPGHYDSYQGTTTYPFNLSSLTPTLNTSTADYAARDWYGSWSKTSFSYSTVRGTYPSGSEPYDVEAVYFDDDPVNVYVAIVTSFNPVPGQAETRYSGHPVLVGGDLAIDTGKNPVGANGVSYDYGLNLNSETRTGGNAIPGSATPGTDIYRTANGDWYLGTPGYAVAGSALTNFDPLYSALGLPEGTATVSMYQYLFAGGKLEGGWPTYVIEATIPRELLDQLSLGQLVGLSYYMGCRNDGFVFYGDIDHEYVPEPASLALLGVGLVGLYLGRRRRRAQDSVL